MNPRKLLLRLLQGQLANVSFADLRRLVEAFGFRLTRVRGSHHLFARPGIPELINLQQAGREAKPYQVRQLLQLVERYNLRLEGDS